MPRPRAEHRVIGSNRLFDSLPLSNHPGLFLALPSSQSLARAASASFDVILAQTGSGLLDLGVWLRAGAGVPLLCVNTIHLPSVYNVLLPDALNARADVTDFEFCLRDFADVLDIRMLPEQRLVPELRLAPRLRGWYRQQLVKLAIYERVQSELYLTLDADVICTKHVRAEQLAPDGRGPCHVIERDLHPDWYRGSEAVLGLSGPRRGVLHNVTPAILHRRGVAELAEYLEERARRGAAASGVRGLKQRLVLWRARRCGAQAFAGWRLLLAGGAPWTEYALYYTFLEATGSFERFHRYHPVCIYDIERSTSDRALRDTSRPGFWSCSQRRDRTGKRAREA